MHNILIALREKRGLSVKELANRLGYSHSSIHVAEQGKRITDKLLNAYNKYFYRDFPDKMELTCYHCGNKFTVSDELVLYCPKCCKQKKQWGRGVRIVKEKKEKLPSLNPNPITRDTVMIICMFHLEGQTVKEIASHLMRPEKVIEKILTRAIRDGRYQMYKNMKQAGPVFLPGAFSLGCTKATKKVSIREDKE